MKAFPNRKIRLAALCLLLTAVGGLARAAEPGAVTAIYFTEVPPSLRSAFEDGMKRFLACIRSHGGTFTALTYTELSDRGRYVTLEPFSSFAEMEAHEHDKGEIDCLDLFRAGVLPNFSQWSGQIALINPKLSYMGGGAQDPAPMLWMHAFRYKPGQRANFIEGEEKHAAAAAQTHSDIHFTAYDIYGAGQSGPTLLYLAPSDSWVDIGRILNLNASPGKAAARANHLKLADSLAEEWSDVWIYDKELSYVQAK